MVAVVLSRRCRYCSKDKAHIVSGQVLRDGTKVFRDEKGCRWAGWRCPACERSRVSDASRRNKIPLESVAKKLEEDGYKLKQLRPILQVEKDGQLFRVSTCLGKVENGQIKIKGAVESPKKNELHVVVFPTIRILNSHQMIQILER